MASRALRVLLIDDDDVDDLFLIREKVEGDDGAIVCDIAGSYQGGETAILDGNYDACLVSHRSGAKPGIDFIRDLEGRASGPLIFLTGAGGTELHDEALAAGATDCFEKERITTEGIRRSIRHAILMWNERSRYQSLFDDVPVGLLRGDPKGVLVEMNATAVEMLGYSDKGSLMGAYIPDLFVEKARISEASTAASRMPLAVTNLEIAKSDGTMLWVDVTLRPVYSTGGTVTWVEWAVIEVTQRREAERQADVRAELLDQVHSAVIVTDNDGICTFWNRHAETMYGWTATEAVGRPITELTVLEGDASVATEIMEQIAAEGRWEGEITVRRKDGSSFRSQVSHASLTDERGNVVGVVGVSLELTVSRRAEDRIRFQASALDQVHHAAMATDMTGAITYWNRRAETLLGWTESEVIGRSLVEVVLAEKAPEFLANLYTALAEHGTWEGEATLVRKDGSTFPAWASDTLIRDIEGNPVGFVGVKVDMTDIKQAEQHARSQETLNRTLLEAVSVPIAILDKNAQLIVSNPSWERITRATLNDGGYVPTGGDGRTTPGLATKVRNGIADVIGGVTDRFVIEYPCAGVGNDRWFRTVVAEAENGAVISHWDITDERIAKATLEATIRAKDAFIASVSHELRTPLTAVLGFSESLRSGTVATDDADELITLIADQAQEVSLIVEDLLVAGRLDNNTLTIKPTTLDMADETNKVIQPWIRKGKKDIGVAFTPGASVAFADPLRVRQILRNLVTNANRYGRPPVSVSGSMREGRCVVTVTDHGRGIPSYAEATMFDPYASFGSVDGQPLSVGLGLHVARGLARLMGGDLTYQRHDGETIFELSLPSKSQVDSDTIELRELPSPT